MVKVVTTLTNDAKDELACMKWNEVDEADYEMNQAANLETQWCMSTWGAIKWFLKRWL